MCAVLCQLTDVSEKLSAQTLLSLPVCSLSVDLSLLQRWCKLLEKHRCPEAPEALRAACAQALCLCGVHVVTRSLTEGLTLKELSTRYNKELFFDNSISLWARQGRTRNIISSALSGGFIFLSG